LALMSQLRSDSVAWKAQEAHQQGRVWREEISTSPRSRPRPHHRGGLLGSPGAEVAREGLRRSSRHRAGLPAALPVVPAVHQGMVRGGRMIDWSKYQSVPGGLEIGGIGGFFLPTLVQVGKCCALAKSGRVQYQIRPRGDTGDEFSYIEVTARYGGRVGKITGWMYGFHLEAFESPEAFINWAKSKRWSVGGELGMVRGILLSAFTPLFADKWLHAANPRLGGRVPLEMIELGKADEVKVAAEAMVAGDRL